MVCLNSYIKRRRNTMFIEGFIGSELNRMRDDQYRRIEARAVLYQMAHGSSRREVRSRIGTTLIRAGASVAGIRVDDCLDGSMDVSPARI